METSCSWTEGEDFTSLVLDCVVLCRVDVVGDDWVLDCNGEFWNRDQPVRFKHYHTNG